MKGPTQKGSHLLVPNGGKAGFVRIQGQQMVNVNRPDTQQIRDEWKTWLDNYILETKEIINHQTEEEIKCIDCGMWKIHF